MIFNAYGSIQNELTPVFCFFHPLSLIYKNIHNMNKDILSLNDFVNYADISKSRAYKAVHNKELPYFKPHGGKVYFKLEDVKNWLLQNRVDSKSEIEAKAASMT